MPQAVQILRAWAMLCPLITIANASKRKGKSAEREEKGEPKERWAKIPAGKHTFSDKLSAN